MTADRAPEGFLTVNLNVTVPEGFSVQQVATISRDAFGKVNADVKVIGDVDRVLAASQLRMLADLVELGE